MMKLYVMALLVLSALVSPPVTYGADNLGNDAYIALKKLQARCEAGISYRDYSPALGETKLAVNLFIESSEAKANSEFASLISKTMLHYEIVNNLWDYYISACSGNKWRWHDCILTDSERGKALLSIYPDLKTEKTHDKYQTSVYPEPVHYEHKKHIVYNSAIESIWAAASRDLRTIANLRSKKEAELTSQMSEIEKLRKENNELKEELTALKRKCESTIQRPRNNPKQLK